MTLKDGPRRGSDAPPDALSTVSHPSRPIQQASDVCLLLLCSLAEPGHSLCNPSLCNREVVRADSCCWPPTKGQVCHHTISHDPQTLRRGQLHR